MEKEYKVSWLKVAFILLLIILFITIIYLLYPKKNNNNMDINRTYINNITLMKEAGFEYFKGDNLPTEVGEARRLSLENMEATNKIVEFLDEEGKSCDKENSYIEATKINKSEYDLKVYLSCNNKKDFLVTSIIKEEVTCTNCNNPSTEKPSTNNKPTTSGNKKPTTNTGSSLNNNNCSTGSCTYSKYYTVNYDYDNGSTAKELVKEGATAPYKNASKEGYTFIGWYLNNAAYNFASPITRSITLKAKYQKNENKVNKYTVTFDSKGGSSINDQIVVSGNTATKPQNPTKSCYIFDGWYLNGSKYNFNNKVTNNITLEAKWIYDEACDLDETYTVKFNSNGGSRVKTQTVYEGDRAYYPSDPTRDGYIFVGWYYNNKEFNFNTRIYRNYTLEARWEEDYSNYTTYCKIEKERIYSTGYTLENSINNKNYETYNYSVKYLRYTPDLKVLGYGTTPTSEYSSAYNFWKNKNKPIYMSSDKSLDVDPGGYYNLSRSSLTSSNMTPIVRVGNRVNNYYTFDITLNLYNLRNIYNTSFYASNIRSYVYFMPIYFDVEYVDTNNCFEDKESNSYKYKNYYMY